MGTFFGTKNLGEQLARTVGDQMLLCEVGCDLVEVTHGGVQCAKQVHGHRTGVQGGGGSGVQAPAYLAG